MNVQGQKLNNGFIVASLYGTTMAGFYPASNWDKEPYQRNLLVGAMNMSNPQASY